ncbi:MAG: leucine-rich repeat protein [Paludibacteraceae bacterium]|nr:leucine-rich repeat protein [Paludibacteraceae bacterium]
MKRIASLIMMLCVFCISNAANYLTFAAEEDGSTFGILNKNNNPDVQYSLDGGETWTALVKGDAITLVHKGDKALLRGDNPEGFSKGYDKYSSFTMTGKIAASGSVMSLIDGTGETLVVPADYCFYSLFEGCTSLTQSPELPATTLAYGCYAHMFKGCTSLTQSPELPATTLAERCYNGMFEGCTSLTQAPELPTTTLADVCYQYMFEGCTSLTQAPELPATTLADYCYQSMFKGCISLTQAPELPATTLAERCYDGMFSGCTSLTQAPELPATTLAESCCQKMFSGCTSLTQAPKLPVTTLAYSCYYGMFEICTSLTQAPELPATTLADGCYQYMFSGCTSLTQAPELPATTLADYCYSFMFKGCTSLTQAPELPATTLADGCYAYMFKGCTSLTHAPELPALELPADPDPKSVCYGEMFSGCTNLSEIRVAFVEWKNSSDQEDNTYRWVENVGPTGTFYCPKALPLEYGADRIPEGWTVKYIEEGTGVNDAVSSEIAVWTEGNTIYIRDSEGDVEVYDMLGRLIVSKRGGQEIIQIPVPQKGIYVVKVGTETHKVEL